MRCADEHELDELASWIIYHHMLGVSLFVLASHHCSDQDHARFMQSLDNLACHPPIMILDAFRCARPGFQASAYRAAVDMLLHGARTRSGVRVVAPRSSTHVAFFDADEYLVGPIHELLTSRYVDLGMWLINTTVFGSSSRMVRPAGFVPANFVMAAAQRAPSWLRPTDFESVEKRRFHKSACRLVDMAARKLAIFPGQGGTWVHECLRGTEGSLLGREPSRVGPAVRELRVGSAVLPSQLLRVHHYFVKSNEEFQHKLRRGRVDIPPKGSSRERESYEQLFHPLYNDRADLALLEQSVHHIKARLHSTQTTTVEPSDQLQMWRQDTRGCSARVFAARLALNHTAYPADVRTSLEKRCLASPQSVACWLVGPKARHAPSADSGRRRPHFEQLNGTGHCCQADPNKRILVTKSTGRFRDPKKCMGLCAADPHCRFFSHSEHLGSCALCSACSLALDVQASSRAGQTQITGGNLSWQTWARRAHVIVHIR